MSAPGLVFVLGPPRGGTTLLQRMLAAQPGWYAPAEPHLLPALAATGPFGTVRRAPYDPVQTCRAAATIVDALPNGEADWVDAYRKATDHLYGRLAEAAGAGVLVDKTPANSLVWPFLVRLYPHARYIVLTRHPFAVWSSYARSFFDDDWEAALAWNPILDRYVPALADLLRAAPVRHLAHLPYEDLVTDPAGSLTRLGVELDLTIEPSRTHYGDGPVGLGDPTGIDRARAPDPSRRHGWVTALRERPDRRAFLARLARRLDDDDLRIWGTPREALWTPLEAVDPPPGPRRRLDRHHIQRAVLTRVRRDLHHRRLGRWLTRLRDGLDVVLRDPPSRG